MAEAEREQLGERTEQPTELRLAEARRRGQVARSVELASAASALAAAIALGLAGPGLLNEMTKMTATFLDGRNASLDVRSGELRVLVPSATGSTLAATAALLAACAALAGLAAFIQVGPMVVAERVAPDWTRLSPAAGLGRLLSLRTLVRAAATLAKLGALAAIGYWAFRPVMARLLTAGAMEPRTLAGEAGSLAWAAGLTVGGCLLALGLLDYLYEWWQRRQDLRMTRQEVRQEQKKTEGDWRIRHRRRDVGRKLVTRIGGEQGRRERGLAPNRSAGSVPVPFLDAPPAAGPPAWPIGKTRASPRLAEDPEKGTGTEPADRFGASPPFRGTLGRQTDEP